MPNLAKIFLDSHLVKKKKNFSRDELEELVRTENYGESPNKRVEIFTKMTNTVPRREVKLIVFPDESAAAFRQHEVSGAFERPSATMSMKDAIRNSHATFASSGDRSNIYKNSDGADVVVSRSPSPSSSSPKGKSKSSKKSRGGTYIKKSRRSRSRRSLTRKHSSRRR